MRGAHGCKLGPQEAETQVEVWVQSRYQEQPWDETCGRRGRKGTGRKETLGCGAGGLMMTLAVPMMTLAVPTGSPGLGQPFRVVLTWTKMAWPLFPALISY